MPPDALALMRMLKHAGLTPPEIAAMKAIANVEKELAALPTSERVEKARALVARIAQLREGLKPLLGRLCRDRLRGMKQFAAEPLLHNPPRYASFALTLPDTALISALPASFGFTMAMILPIAALPVTPEAATSATAAVITSSTSVSLICSGR